MEIELKLALPAQHAARLRKHPLLSAFKPAHHPLHSLYFDTPQFDLMRRTIALRLRRVGGVWIQTMKADARPVGVMSSRSEWETTVACGTHPDFAALPQEALVLLQGIDLTHIVPAFITEFQRTTWQITQGEDHAELALDLGEIQAHGKHLAISEVEIELKSGRTEFLFELATQLLTHAPLHIEPRSKAGRGYVLCGAQLATPINAISPEIHPRQSAAESWRALMQAALAQCVANLPGFLEQGEDIEYLHQLRVALRRLRVGDTLVRGLGLPAPTWSATLKESMNALNPARDWDVFLQETLPSLALTQTESVRALLENARAHVRRDAQALLLKPAFTQLILDIERDLLRPPATPEQEKARPWAAKILQKRWEALNKRCQKFATLCPNERHLARIAAKKMRYAADALTPLYGKNSRPFIKALAALQNSLGSANDAQVGAQLLHALPKESALQAFELGRLAGTLESETKQRAHLSNTVWHRLARTKLFWCP